MSSKMEREISHIWHEAPREQVCLMEENAKEPHLQVIMSNLVKSEHANCTMKRTTASKLYFNSSGCCRSADPSSMTVQDGGMKHGSRDSSLTVGGLE